jgi:DNA polymerase-3 subunit epsilon
MLICGLDFETTGLLPTKHSVVEVGAVLWDTEIKSPLRVEGFLVDPGEDAVWDQEAIDVSGISPQLVQKFGIDSADAMSRLVYLMGVSDAVCAHNGNVFDRPFAEEWATREGGALPEKLWIDTKCDLELGPKASTKLIYMAADLGFVNPFAHRAVTDVLTMLRVLSGFDIERVVFLAKQPNIQIEALVSFDDKQLAKDRGYHWKPPYRRRKEKQMVAHDQGMFF